MHTELAIRAAVFTCLAVAGGYWDIRWRKIPNVLSLAMAGLGLLAAFAISDGSAVLDQGLHMLAALLVGIGIFALGWWGGGDGKFYAATAAWFPIMQFFQLILWISVAGLLLVLFSLAFRRKGRLRFSLSLRRKPDDDAQAGLPYGAAIAAGGILTVLGDVF